MPKIFTRERYLMNSLANPCIIGGKINFIIHINYFGSQFQAPAFLTKLKCPFAQRRIYVAPFHMWGGTWAMSVLNTQRVKKYGLVSRSSFSCSLTGNPSKWIMLPCTLVLQLLYFVWKCIVLDTREASRAKWSNLWPWWFSVWSACALLSASYSLSIPPSCVLNSGIMVFFFV